MISNERLANIAGNLIGYLDEYIGQREDFYEVLSNSIGMTDNEIDQLSGNFDSDRDEVDFNVLYLDDITGTLGQWLEMDTSDIPREAMVKLQEVYNLCAAELN